MINFGHLMGQNKRTNDNKKPPSNQTQPSNGKITLNTLLIFLPIFSLVFFTAIVILIRQEKLEMILYKSAEISVVESKLTNIETQIEHAMHDLLIFTSNTQIERLGNDYENTESIEDMAGKMLNIVTYQKLYDQVRFINEDGMEVIRINFNNGNPVVVPQNKLQNKKDRYYFHEAFQLQRGEIFISPMDLNIENGKIEEPLKPMIRIATPVFDNQNVKRGIILFNFFGEKILNHLENKANTIIETQLMLLNKEGYLLKYPITENEWGFMYDDKKDITFSNLYTNAWGKIEKEESSQFETGEGLFTFKTIYPLVKGQNSSFGSKSIDIANNSHLNYRNYYWKIVSFVPHKILYSKQNERRQYIVLLLALFSMSLLFISWKLAKTQYYRAIALQSLEISNQTKDKFFSIIAHDLRSPFNSLLGFSDLLMEETEKTDNSDIRKFSTVINTTLNNTYNLLINLLEWSRSQTNKIEYKPEPFLLGELIDEIIELLVLQADNKKITMNNSVPKDLTIIADRNMLNTVIRNLVSNALKYTNEGGKVSVSAAVQNAGLHCAVSDTGVGMSKEQVNTLYSLANIKSTPGTNNENGTGLGLMLCRELIEKHKGRMGIKSEIGKGSTFWFEIPNSSVNS